MKQNKYKPEPSPPKGKKGAEINKKKPSLKIFVAMGLVILMSLGSILQGKTTSYITRL